MTKRLALVAACVFAGALLAGSAPAPAADTGSYTIASGTAGFTATGKPGFLHINGEGASVHGTWAIAKDQLTAAEVKIALKELSTGIDLRDSHMKEKYLEVEKYPEAVFRAKDVALGIKAPSDLELKGDLTLHGVTKPVTVALSLKDKGKSVEGEGDFEILLSDFGIDIPKYMGVTVAETVKVHVTFTGATP